MSGKERTSVAKQQESSKGQDYLQEQSKQKTLPGLQTNILALQRAAGNRAVSQLLQTKLAINQPGDEYEREADQVADQIMRMPQSQPQRKCACGGTPGPDGECEACKQKRLAIQRKAIISGESSVIPPIVHEVLRSPGQPLDSATRSFMESRFSHDFSSVQVHTDGKAAQSAAAVKALAYTVGHNIVFGTGQYSLRTPQGQRLIAHEIAHVVQQSGTQISIQRAPKKGESSPQVTSGDPNIKSNDPNCQYDDGEVAKSYTSKGWLDFDVATADDYGIKPGDAPVFADFRVNDAHLRPSMEESYKRYWALQMKERKSLEIVGYSDCSSKEKNNKFLREQRAQSVARLIPGVPTRAAPDDGYLIENSSPRGRAINRSVIVQSRQLPPTPTPPEGASAPAFDGKPLSCSPDMSPPQEPRSRTKSLGFGSHEELIDEIERLREWVNWLDCNRIQNSERDNISSELTRLEAVASWRSERAAKKERRRQQIERIDNAVNAGRIPKWMKVFPFRPTRGLMDFLWHGEAAQIKAWRDGDFIYVHQGVITVKRTLRYSKDVRTLPDDVFSGAKGHALKPKELVGVRLYDEDEKVVVIFAEDLLKFSDASERAQGIAALVTVATALGGPVASKVGSKASSFLANVGQKATSSVGNVGQKALMSTMLGTAEASPAFTGWATSASIGLVEKRAISTVAQQTIAQSTVRVGTQAAVQSTAQTATQAAVQAAPAVTQSLTNLAIRSGEFTSASLGTAATAVVGQQLAPIPGVPEVRVTPEQYQAAQGLVFPSHSLDFAYSLVDSIGHRAAQRALANPLFRNAVQNGNMTLAGTFFHSAAATVARSLPATALPTGWRLEAESTIQAGLGGSRADILLHGPSREILEFDWKPRGWSALSTGSRREMQRHTGQITANIGGNLTRQESRSWIDFVRPLWPDARWP